jgi:hypothetical protein
MDRLLIASEHVRRIAEVADMCRPWVIGSRAVASRGMHTHLASLADRWPGNPLGRQAQPYRSVPCSVSIANWVEDHRSDGRDLVDCVHRRPFRSAARSSNARQLVGEGRGEPCCDACDVVQPHSEGELLPVLRSHQDDVRRIIEASVMRWGRSRGLRKRLPVAAKIAFVTAGTIAEVPASPSRLEVRSSP